jgi:hypothetical protein
VVLVAVVGVLGFVGLVQGALEGLVLAAVLLRVVTVAVHAVTVATAVGVGR